MGKRQTRDWKWTIEVTNSHTQPVAVRVEDPEPQIGDSAIEVKVVAKPAPVVKDHVNTWNFTVSASGKSVIDYTVEAHAWRTCALSTEGRVEIGRGRGNF